MSKKERKIFVLVRLEEDLGMDKKGEMIQLVDWLAEKLMREGRAKLVKMATELRTN